MLVVRLIRSLWAFGVIFLSYMLQLGLVRAFGTRKKDATGFRYREVPPWLKERRRRVDAKNARRLLRSMLRLRGVFIKLGQVLSIMGGFLPRVYGKELEQLQDQVPPHPFSALDKAVRDAFGKGHEEVFADIEREPIAAASLGQVHRAHLKDGRKVAVKFLYPNIRAVVAVDMRVVKLAVIVYRWFVPVAKIERAHESLVDLLRRETDYVHEAACMTRMAANFKDDEGLAFPVPIDELTTQDVLTMTFMEGIKITRLESIRRAHVEPKDVAVRLTQFFFKSLFVHRYFHADPHPGNFLVTPKKDGAFDLVILDFGAISEVKAEMVDGMLEILRGVFGQDDALVLKGFRAMGFVAEGGNDKLLERTVKTYFSKLLKIKDRSPAALMRARPDQLERLADPEVERGELQELMRSVEYPEDWFYVERACVVAFWLAAQIDPELDAVTVGFPYVMPLLAAKMSGGESAAPPAA